MFLKLTPKVFYQTNFLEKLFLDINEYIDKRTRKLVKDGAVVACIAISKTESKSALDNLARCMASFCRQSNLAGFI